MLGAVHSSCDNALWCTTFLPEKKLRLFNSWPLDGSRCSICATVATLLVKENGHTPLQLRQWATCLRHWVCRCIFHKVFHPASSSLLPDRWLMQDGLYIPAVEMHSVQGWMICSERGFVGVNATFFCLIVTSYNHDKHGDFYLQHVLVPNSLFALSHTRMTAL